MLESKPLADILIPKSNYYGTKYGSFSWVRGVIDIYDQDDIEYIELCLEKIKLRFTEESEQKEKNKK